MDEQLKLAHKVADVVERANKDLSDSAAVQCGQARHFFRTIPIICTEEGRREISTNCVSEK